MDRAGYFDNVPGGTAHDFRRDSVNMLEDLGISVEFSHHEGGAGQNEIDLRYADALTTADNIMTFRTVVKEVAIAQGVYATFMPKPLVGQPGSGMHTHMSLFEGDTNAFYDAGARSTSCRRRGGGSLRGCCVMPPSSPRSRISNINSYKRLWGGDEAPSYVSWGHLNRSSAGARAHVDKPGKGGSARIEYRGIDSAANPYLAFSVMLAAGLKGIEGEYELPPKRNTACGTSATANAGRWGSIRCQLELDHALAVMERSELVAETLWEQVFSYLLREKRQEVAAYRQQVTPSSSSRCLAPCRQPHAIRCHTRRDRTRSACSRGPGFRNSPVHAQHCSRSPSRASSPPSFFSMRSPSPRTPTPR